VWDLTLKQIMEIAKKDMEYTWRARDELKKEMLKRASRPGMRCLQVGVPHDFGSNYGQNWESLDMYDKRPFITYKRNLADTGLPDAIYDMIECNAILEHVVDPFACANEICRIAKVGCELLVEVPFFQPFHPCKDWNPGMGMFLDGMDDGAFVNDENHGGDYWRYTPQSLAMLFMPFKEGREVKIFEEGGLAFHGWKA